MARSFRRSLLLPVRGLFRPALFLLAWTNRHTVALWARSLRGEFSRAPFDARRSAVLIRALVKVTADSRLANSSALHSLAVDNDVVVARADEHWPMRPVLHTVLEGVDHVSGVRFATPEAAPAEPVMA